MSLLLAQRNAVKRSVLIRIIVQEYTEENRETLKSWQKLGLVIKFGKPIGFHLLLIDCGISYIMSFDPHDKTKRYGVRFVHSAINRQFKNIFEAHWKKAKYLRLEI